MKITILGSGTSTGVPELGCTCKVCTSGNPKDNRMRTSVLVQTQGKNILIDCGPDFRAEMLRVGFMRLDGVLISHEHYDHVGGLDDLRPFCRLGKVSIYAEPYATERIRKRIPYCFVEHKYPGVPQLNLIDINSRQDFYIETVKVTPIRVMHGQLPILGYRIGNMAYITDMLTLPEEEYAKLEGLSCLIMNALRIEPHFTHQNLEQALANAKRIGAKQTYFIHMSHQMGLHTDVEKALPATIRLSYDGEVIEL